MLVLGIRLLSTAIKVSIFKEEFSQINLFGYFLHNIFFELCIIIENVLSACLFVRNLSNILINWFICTQCELPEVSLRTYSNHSPVSTKGQFSVGLRPINHRTPTNLKLPFSCFMESEDSVTFIASSFVRLWKRCSCLCFTAILMVYGYI